MVSKNLPFIRSNKAYQGFTLIELLIVIAILAILATVVFVGIDPLARFQDTRNSKRATDVNNILSAIKLHQVDNKGLLLASIDAKASGTPFMIGTNTGDCTTACANPALSTNASCVDISDLVTGGGGTAGGYMPAVPTDPTGGTLSMTGYYLIKNINKTITIGTCNEEQGTNATAPDLSASR